MLEWPSFRSPVATAFGQDEWNLARAAAGPSWVRPVPGQRIARASGRTPKGNGLRGREAAWSQPAGDESTSG